MNPTTPKTTPKDFFLHLGATVALYIAAAALINLSFSVINYFFPDALAGYFYGNAVAWPISMLVILVPILYIFEWLIKRDISKTPKKAEIWVRRWRIYLTLFLVIFLMAGDLIALINVYLNGEITARFIYKILVILVVAGTIGKYYFFSLNTSYRWSKFSTKFHTYFGIIIVIVAIVMGFLTIGSPAKQRALRFDSQRINDLSNIQWRVINYWQVKDTLPKTLGDINDPISGTTEINDPETKSEYEYSVNSNLSFELCATFGEPTQDTKGRGANYGRGGSIGVSYPAYDMSYPYPEGVDQNWTHKKGRTCFVRTIDPDRYPKETPTSVTTPETLKR